MSKKRVVILGESPLVEEYSSLCHNRGFSVGIRPERKSGRIPTGYSRVAKITRSFEIAIELTNLDVARKRETLEEISLGLSADAPIMSSCVTVPIEEQGTWISHRERLVGLGSLPTFLENSLVELCVLPETDATILKRVHEFIRELGREHAEVTGGVGLVMPRIICSIINETCFAMAEGVAGSQDIDIAMKLGTNYPHGPVEWGERIGPRHVLGVMDALHKFYQEERYRPSPLLQRAALKNSFFPLL
jgi:3-hydroxybutyryl-CoA dehydrogenase